MHARLGHDAALAEVIGIKNKADHDLRSLEYLARLFTNALALLEQVKSNLRELEELHVAIAQIDHRLRSRDLLDALEDARWQDAHDLLENIDSELRQMLDFGRHDTEIPRSLQDAYRILNVGDGTPLEQYQGRRECLPARMAYRPGAR